MVKEAFKDFVDVSMSRWDGAHSLRGGGGGGELMPLHVNGGVKDWMFNRHVLTASRDI